MCNFRINQEAAIRERVDDPKFPYKNGDIVTIQGLRKSICACNIIEVNIGLSGFVDIPIGGECVCSTCGADDYSYDNIWWINSERLAPLQTDSEEEDMKEAIAEVMERELYA